MSEEFTLRQAVAVDASALLELTRAAYAKCIPVIGREPKPMMANYVEAVLKHCIDLLWRRGWTEDEAGVAL
jgi:hypothetical protein